MDAAQVEFALEAIVILDMDCKKATSTARLELVRHKLHELENQFAKLHWNLFPAAGVIPLSSFEKVLVC